MKLEESILKPIIVGEIYINFLNIFVIYVSVEELSHYVFKIDLFIKYPFMIVVLTLPR